jgi:hypothetical protein
MISYCLLIDGTLTASTMQPLIAAPSGELEYHDWFSWAFHGHEPIGALQFTKWSATSKILFSVHLLLIYARP